MPAFPNLSPNTSDFVKGKSVKSRIPGYPINFKGGEALPNIMAAQWDTQMLWLDPENFSDKDIQPAVAFIQQGEVVAFPTETVYGLGASIYSEAGIHKIFEAKGRPQDNPLIVHIANLKMLPAIIEGVPQPLQRQVQALQQRFWPGPLTLLFQKSDKVLPQITAGLSTVAVRMPSNPIARRLIELCGVPIAAPSANLSGKPSPTTAQHVWDDFAGRIPCIIDGGPCHVGVESTVVDLHRIPPTILRPGGLNFEALQEMIPSIQIYEKTQGDRQLEARPSTPGLKYKHYSPKAKVILIEYRREKFQDKILQLIDEFAGQNAKMAFINTFDGETIRAQARRVFAAHFIDLSQVDGCGLTSLQERQQHIAHQIFGALRTADEKGVDAILIPGISEDFEGLAVMNRLRKAASKRR